MFQKISQANLKFSPAFAIEMAEIGPLRGGEGAVIYSAWGRIAPGKSTRFHRHIEFESILIVKGGGKLLTDGCEEELTEGDFLNFSPFEEHVIENTGETALEFFDLYWLPSDLIDSNSPEAGEREAEKNEYVFSTPPTPNGDLHLGHIAGPYLGADIYTRFLRMKGRNVLHVTGSDDHQSYVVAKGLDESTDSRSTAEKYGSAIQESLRVFDIHVDLFLKTHGNEDLAKDVSQFVQQLIGSGAVRTAHAPACFDSETDQYLYEVDILGKCPNCNAPCGGNICEECGHPNHCIDLIDPVSRLSGKPPVVSSARQLLFDLRPFEPAVDAHLRKAYVSPRIRKLKDEVFSSKSTEFAISHPANWGVKTSFADLPEQVVWVWVEMACSFIHSIGKLRAMMSLSADQRLNDGKFKITHFMGYDNSFYHCILFPALYWAAYDEIFEIDYIYNEFSLLDGKKFSTSRRHAIWARDILESSDSDCVRFYLALTRAEHERTDFRLDAFHWTCKDILSNRWATWIEDLKDRVEDNFDGLAPEPGHWSVKQIAFFRRLNSFLKQAEQQYGAIEFSPRSVTRSAIALVDATIEFRDVHSHLAGNLRFEDEYRTTICLELAALNLLACIIAPIMPRFSFRLLRSLGAVIDREQPIWPDTVSLVPTGQDISKVKCTWSANSNTNS